MRLIESGKEKSKGWKVQGRALRLHTITLINSFELPLLAGLLLTTTALRLEGEHHCSD